MDAGLPGDGPAWAGRTTAAARPCGGPGDAAVAIARAAWLRLVEPPSPSVVALIEAVGPVVALEAVFAGEAPPDVLAVDPCAHGRPIGGGDT